MRAAAALLCFTLAACGGPGSGMPVQQPGAVVAGFNAAIAGCTAPLTPAGLIDQAGIASAGWTVASRVSMMNDDRRTHALDAYPTLQAGEYEAVSWAHRQHGGTLYSSRWDVLTTNRSPDTCMLDNRVRDADALAAIVTGITRSLGRAPERVGAIPRGGDFLTPRNDAQRTGYYWAQPTHDVYVETDPGGFARLNVVAMPDRDALDEYSPDRPENRLIILPGEPPQ